MKTFMASPATIDRKWYVVDATDMTLGRLASEVAKVLRGKNKPIFTPHIDCGDNVIVINAEKIKVTGKKDSNLLTVVEKKKIITPPILDIALERYLEANGDDTILKAITGVV